MFFAWQVAEFSGLALDEETLFTVMHYIRPDRGGGNIDASYLATAAYSSEGMTPVSRGSSIVKSSRRVG